MERRILESQKAILFTHCEQLAQEGLRALVFAQKVLSQEECDQLLAELEEANQQQDDQKHYRIMESLKRIE